MAEVPGGVPEDDLFPEDDPFAANKKSKSNLFDDSDEEEDSSAATADEPSVTAMEEVEIEGDDETVPVPLVEEPATVTATPASDISIFDVSGGDEPIPSGGISKPEPSSEASSHFASSRPQVSASGMVVTVEDPEKLSGGTFGSYTAYTVRTIPGPAGFIAMDGTTLDTKEIVVLRRFSDFLWLRDHIMRENYGRLCPPMPPKHNMQRDKFDAVFLETRRAALEKFVQRIAAHPVLSCSKCFKMFLETKNTMLPNAKKACERSVPSRVNDSVSALALKMLLKKKDESVVKLGQQVDDFEVAMKRMEAASQAIVEATQNMSKYGADLGANIRSLPEKEPEVLKPMLEKLQEALYANAESLEQMPQAVEAAFVAPMREYRLYTDSFRTLTTHFNTLHCESQVLRDMLQSEESNRNSIEQPNSQTKSIGAIMGENPDDVRARKLEQSKAQISTLSAQVEQAEDSVEVAKANLDADTEAFMKMQSQDFTAAFGTLAAYNVKHIQKMLGVWDALIADMDSA